MIKRKNIETKFIHLILTKFPVIEIVIKKKINEPQRKDIDEGMEHIKRILNTTTQPFVILIDCKDAYWLKADIRDYYSISFQVLENEYQERHKGTFLFTPSITVFILSLLIKNFVSSPYVKTSRNKKKLMEKAIKRVESFSESKISL